MINLFRLLQPGRLLPPGAWTVIYQMWGGLKRVALADSSQNRFAFRSLSAERSARTRKITVLPPLLPLQALYPEIDVSLVTYNSYHLLEGFFKSLRAQAYPLNSINLRVVDHGSSDRSVETLADIQSQLGAKFRQFEIIERPNLGYGSGHDTAIRLGREEFCLVLNPDVQFEWDTITVLVSTALADQAMIASWEARQKPFEHLKYYDPVTCETTWCSHACVLLRRSAYEAVAGYEHLIFMYGEDVELSYRLRSHGYRLRYVPHSIVWRPRHENAGAIKPLAYRGTTLANPLLRLRYGTRWDAIMGFLMLAGLIFRPEIYKGSRKDILMNIRAFIVKAPKFLRRTGIIRLTFPFRGFGYEMLRDGAAVEGVPSPKPSPLVSIVIRTCLGRESILRQAIASALQQTHPAMEIIVVEDGGETMSTLIEAYRLVTNTPILYKGISKVGRAGAGNAGLEMASGFYVNFLDDDDLLFADHVETLIAALTMTPSASAAYALALEVPTAFEPDYSACREDSFETPAAHRQSFDQQTLWHHNFLPIQACLFERILFLERGGFDTELDLMEDWNLWLRYSHEKFFVYVPKTTSLYRVPADIKARRTRREALQANSAVARAKAEASVSFFHSKTKETISREV